MSKVYVGDCLEVFGGHHSVFEAAVADLPAGVSFMGLKFDVDHGGQDQWVKYMAARVRVMREACIPGAYGLFWSLPRTSHWTARAVELAGYKIIDSVSHLQGQGWPKGRGQLKPAREDWILCRDPRGKVRPLNIDACRVRRSWAEHSPAWFRGGHSAKPGAQKISGAPPGNGIHVHEGGSWPPHTLLSHASCCRPVGTRQVEVRRAGGAGLPKKNVVYGEMGKNLSYDHPAPLRDGCKYMADETIPAFECLAVCSCGLASLSPAGGAPTPCLCGEERWFACPVAALDEQSGFLKNGGSDATSPADYAREGLFGGGITRGGHNALAGDSGGASRFFPTFFYDAKSSRRERQSGCEHLLWIRDDSAPIGWRRVTAEEHKAAPENERRTGNTHSTIKPIGCGDDDGLMRWLVRLVTPEGGPVVDGTCGSGGTLVAAQIEGRDSEGCDIDPGAVAIAEGRLAFWTPERHRQVLADRDALKAHEIAVAREKAAKEPPRPEDLGPLFARTL
jgi:hypothetical protein